MSARFSRSHLTPFRWTHAGLVIAALLFLAWATHRAATHHAAIVRAAWGQP